MSSKMEVTGFDPQNEEVIDFDVLEDQLNDEGQGGPEASATGETETTEESSPETGEADAAAPEGESAPEKEEADPTDETPKFANPDTGEFEEEKASGEEGAEKGGEETTEAAGEENLPEGWDAQDPMVSALQGLYKTDQEMAEKIHDLINEQKRIVASGAETERINNYLENHKEIDETLTQFDALKTDLAETGAYAKSGNWGEVIKKMGFDVKAAQDYFVSRALAEEDGKLQEFDAHYGKDQEKIHLMMENQRLKQESQQTAQNYHKQIISDFETKLRQDPLMGQINKMMKDPGFGEREFTQVFAAMPEGQRNLDVAHKAWREKMQNYLSMFGAGTTPTPPTTESGEKSARPRGLNPPSKSSGGKSPAGRKVITVPKSEEEWLSKSYA